MSEHPGENFVFDESVPQRAARAMADRGAELARLLDVGIVGHGTDRPSVVLHLALDPREVWLAVPAADITDIMSEHPGGNL